MDMYIRTFRVARIFRSGSPPVHVKSRLYPFGIFDTSPLCITRAGLQDRLRIDTRDVFPVVHFSVRYVYTVVYVQ